MIPDWRRSLAKRTRHRPRQERRVMKRPADAPWLERQMPRLRASGLVAVDAGGLRVSARTHDLVVVLGEQGGGLHSSSLDLVSVDDIWPGGSLAYGYAKGDGRVTVYNASPNISSLLAVWVIEAAIWGGVNQPYAYPVPYPELGEGVAEVTLQRRSGKTPADFDSEYATRFLAQDDHVEAEDGDWRGLAVCLVNDTVWWPPWDLAPKHLYRQRGDTEGLKGGWFSFTPVPTQLATPGGCPSSPEPFGPVKKNSTSEQLIKRGITPSPTSEWEDGQVFSIDGHPFTWDGSAFVPAG